MSFAVSIARRARTTKRGHDCLRMEYIVGVKRRLFTIASALSLLAFAGSYDQKLWTVTWQ
jgi:hypothetical protein